MISQTATTNQSRPPARLLSAEPRGHIVLPGRPFINLFINSMVKRRGFLELGKNVARSEKTRKAKKTGSYC
jgi:hypothetical protein